MLLAGLALPGGARAADIPAATSAAPTASTFSGSAEADVVRANLAIPNYLVVQDFVDGGGPSAQAVLDSLGTSQGFASFPYPGETGVAATGLVSTLTGLSLPSYPFIAQSDYPLAPTAAINQPGYHLTATSGATASTSSATLGETTAGGSAEGGAFATATVSIDDAGVLTSHAETRFGLTLGPVVLRGVDAVAQAVRTPDGHVTYTSSLKMAEITVAGIGVELDGEGLVLAGAPLVPAAAITGVANALSIGPTKVAYIPETSQNGTVTSAGLQITVSQQIPAIGHPVDVAYTIGNLSTSVASTAASSPQAVPPPALVLGNSTPSPSPSSFGVPTSGAPTPTPAPPATPTPPPPAAVALPAAPVTRIAVQPLTVSGWSFFPIIVIAGALLAAGAVGSRAVRAARQRGVRRWSS